MHGEAICFGDSGELGARLTLIDCIPKRNDLPSSLVHLLRGSLIGDGHP